MYHDSSSRSPVALLLVAPLLALFSLGSPAFGARDAGAGVHAITLDPSLKDKVSKETLAEVEKFFHEAEAAINAGDLEKLMALYSENYRNEDHDKSSARAIWKRIFDAFEGMSTMHNMRLMNYSNEGKLAVVGCSGILLGKKKEGGERMPVDTWTNEEHILTLEGGSWKLIGSAGLKRKRLWFDKPMHPLF